MEPASPKPSASKAPILLKVYSNTTVSIGPLSLDLEPSIYFDYISDFSLNPPNFDAFLGVSGPPPKRFSFSSSSSKRRRSSSSWAAYSGSSVILLILSIISSIGEMTRSVVSLEKIMAPTPRTTHTRKVVAIPNLA